MSKFFKEINSIIKGLKIGDNLKQQDLYDVTFSNLKVIALKYAADKNDCEDILAEAYLRILKYLKKADLSKDCYNWLCKIVQNVAYDFNKNAVNNLPLDEISATTADGSIEDVIADNDAVLREIEKLKEKDRQILYLRFWQDCTIDQIAAATNSSKSSIHKRMSVLLNKIYSNLNGQ